MHCKAVVANIPLFRRGQSVSQNQFSPFQLLSSSQVPTPKIRPILEEGVKFLHFCPLTSALPGNSNGIRTFLGYGIWRKWESCAEHYSHSNSN